MNRERLTILRDHLAKLPDSRFDISTIRQEDECGTYACLAGWTCELFGGRGIWEAETHLDLNDEQGGELFVPSHPGRSWSRREDYPRADAIAAIQSMLDNPADDALPVWPEKAASQ